MNEFNTGRRTSVTAGNYVGQIAVCIENKLKERAESNSLMEKRTHLQCIPEEESDRYCDKENSYNRPTSSRTSFYCRKFENLTFDPKKPLTNPFRMSNCDQMPVQVLPIPSRAVSMNDVLIRPCSMNGFTSEKNIPEQMDYSMISSCTLDPNFEVGSQSLNRMQLRSSKRRNNENFGPNLGDFTHATKLKSRSEYFLRSSQHHGCGFSGKNENSRVFETSKSTESKKPNLRTRIQKKFGSRRVEKDPAAFREKKSHSRRSNIFHTKNKISSPRKRKSIANVGKISLNLSAKREDFEGNNSSINTLMDVLKNPDVREEFRLFLRTEHSEENLDFWLICEEYKNTSDQSALAKIIFKHFINSGAPREVNLDGKTKSILEENVKNLNRSSFVSSQECVYRLMVQDSFRRFMIMKKRTCLR